MARTSLSNSIMKLNLSRNKPQNLHIIGNNMANLFSHFASMRADFGEMRPKLMVALAEMML